MSLAVNKNFDILKYLMSILIVMIHIGWSETVIITRVAVPVFFILSSYFFFSKINGQTTDKQVEVYRKFLKRSIKLYLFWFIILFPFTYLIRHWNELNLLQLSSELLISILFKKTFPGSWYISAYILGISIAFVLRNHNRFLLIIGVICYLLCCLMSNYHSLFVSCQLSIQVENFFDNYAVYNSFPAGLFFIFIGKIFSKNIAIRSRSVLLSYCIIGIVALYIENYIIQTIGGRETNDCYLSLCFLAPSIFMFIYSLPQIKFKNVAIFRKMSTIYYCTNYSIIVCLTYFYKDVSQMALFFVTIAICTIISLFLIKLASIPKFSIAKYSY